MVNCCLFCWLRFVFVLNLFVRILFVIGFFVFFCGVSNWRFWCLGVGFGGVFGKWKWGVNFVCILVVGVD